MPLAPSHEMNTSKCLQQHCQVQTRKITFSAGIRLSPGPTMAAKLEGGIAAHWRDATPEQLSVSFPVRLASEVIWARP